MCLLDDMLLNFMASVCIFCRCRNVPMLCEPMDRAYKAVSELCMKFRDVHPIAAQTLFSSINSFMRDAVSRRSENCFFWFCRWHFLPQSFDFNGGLMSPLVPSQINAQLLIDNHEKGLVYPDPYSIAIFAPPAVSSSVTSCGFPASLYPMPVTPVVIQFCIICNKVSSSGAMNIDYMILIPPSTAIREQWAANVCPYLKGSVSQEVLNVFRTQEQARLCIRHFNPRSLVINVSGAIMRATSALNELPVVNFSQYANLSAEFSQALEKLLDAMVKNQNSSTVAIMLKIVQELVKCSDERCGRSLNSLADVHLHQFHQLPHNCDVTCCYLCGIADPWQREITGGVKISHELVHAMKRFEVCKACMVAMGRDHKGVVLIDHFIRQHMVDLPKRFRHCKICRQNVVERRISEHILEQHRLIVFAPRFNPQSNGIAVRNGSEFCAYLGIPIEACTTISLADSAEL
ncbi:unnamed protein product [Angiostrongylus costaricensis]|uniref:C2H2-type domain-containing protein n=1 Tax=Angiostrongylus costaricensis TaxID=334426 RepID=A0A0R3PC07_ANGCS|nr:unnamed protein product [Angiostrongylus costaricensis]